MSSVVNLNRQTARRSVENTLTQLAAAIDQMDLARHRELLDELIQLVPSFDDLQMMQVAIVYRMALGVMSGQYSVRHAKDAADVAKAFSGLISEDLLGKMPTADPKQLTAEERRELMQELQAEARRRQQELAAS